MMTCCGLVGHVPRCNGIVFAGDPRCVVDSRYWILNQEIGRKLQLYNVSQQVLIEL